MSQSSLVGIPRNLGATETRRSTRIEKSVPLIISGQNRMGEPFVERTVSVSLNMHGCRYPTRHDCGIGSWVTLQLVGLNNPEEQPATVRAMVRSVHAPASLRELQQVGVELENPANVWGISPPPTDWLSTKETNVSTTQLAPAVASAKDSAGTRVRMGDLLTRSEPKVAEVGSFPSPSPATSQLPVPGRPEGPKPQRLVVTADGLISSLQGKLQEEAERAVQAALAKQVNGALREALASIDNVCQVSIREVQEHFPKRMEALKLSVKEESVGEIVARWKELMDTSRSQAEEMAQRLEKQAADLRRELANAQGYVNEMTREILPQIRARLDEAVSQATSGFDGRTARVVDRHYERLLQNVQAATQEQLSKLDAHAREAGALVQNEVNSALEAVRLQMEPLLQNVQATTQEQLSKLDAHATEAGTVVQNEVNSALEALRQQVEPIVNMALAETKERTVSMLSSFEAESRATCDERRQALETEVARCTERSTEQFRKGIATLLSSCLAAVDGAVDEHSKSASEELSKESQKALCEPISESPAHE